MKKQFFMFTALITMMAFSCNSPQTKPASQQNQLIFHFELDSSGNIKNEDVKQKLASLAKKLSIHADRVMLTAYSEQTGDKAKNRQIAFDMADAAKKFMSSYDERAYFNIGVDIKGYENPINPANPADIQNRRIEFIDIRQ